MLELDIPMLACGPALMVAQMVIGVASAAAGYAAQKQQAKVTLAHQKKRSENSLQRAADRNTQLAQQHTEEQEATTRALEDIEKNTMVASGRAQASAADAGVSGASYVLQQQEMEAWGANLMYSEMMNADSASSRYYAAMTSAGNAATAEQLNILRPVNQPSAAAFGLKAAGSVLDAAGMAKAGDYAPSSWS